MACMCGDSECLSCGEAQGTRSRPRAAVARRGQIWRWNVEWKDAGGVHAVGWTVRAKTATQALRKAAAELPRALVAAGLSLDDAKPGSVRLDLLWVEVLG